MVPLRSENCWAGFPLQLAICTTVPGAVAPQAASMHRLFVRIVPSATTFHTWFASPLHANRISGVPSLPADPLRHLPVAGFIRAVFFAPALAVAVAVRGASTARAVE